MYRTGVNGEPLAGIDDALLRLRRLWSASRSRIVDERGIAAQMSSLLVVEACARGAAAGEEVTVGEVARFADVTASTASRLVDRAEQAGLLRRAPSAETARHTALRLTAEGAALRERALRARLDWLGERVAGWTPGEVADLGRLLGRFADTLEPDHG